MTPFGRQKPPQATEEEQQAAALDLERIREGGIPLGAEQRLSRLASASTPFFTSDLSAKEYALAQASGLQPIAQVMGSSVVQHGWIGNQPYYRMLAEIQPLSDPWNMARARAFDRLRQEAALTGADGVIGIEMSNTGSVGDAGNVEYVVFGTAVRETSLPRPKGGLGMCALSGQDVDKLRRIGAQVRGVVGHTSIVSAQLRPDSNYVMNSSGWLGGAGAMNVEIREVSEAVYAARRHVMSEVRRQAAAVRANEIVVSTLTHSIAHHEYDQGGIRRHYFFVTMHILGTAVTLGAHAAHPAPMTGPALTINIGR